VTIWVDSICINQDDEQERETQVSLMQEIYGSASLVYVWLGPGDRNSDNAMGYLRKRASLGQRIPLTILASTDEEDDKRVSRKFQRNLWGDVLGKCNT